MQLLTAGLAANGTSFCPYSLFHTPYRFTDSGLQMGKVVVTIEKVKPQCLRKMQKFGLRRGIYSIYRSWFSDITIEVEYDIISGWFADVGEVESVTINEEKKFSRHNSYRTDSKEVITYHSLKKDKLIIFILDLVIAE